MGWEQPVSNGIEIEFSDGGEATLVAQFVEFPDLELRARLPLELSGYLEGLARENLAQFTRIVDAAGQRLRQHLGPELTFLLLRSLHPRLANEADGHFQTLFEDFAEGSLVIRQAVEKAQPTSEFDVLKKLLSDSPP